ncbi:RNA-binding domain-containing protein [Cystobasidium minutum MCA 4210]|uniref:RNA-binding domain-containing protein n=1 Tax=Cystobasidium minutum MCA 4210 TaxID=1397322 RepID=UPI0034CEA81D|eukprot:jgi/Rhomi1/163900/estExt_Genewise1Plus.C_90166
MSTTSQPGEKNTIYVGGLSQDVDSQLLYSTFLPFGEILDVQLPPDPTKRDKKQHRGFGFVTFSLNADALDAVDNTHLNELNGRILKVNLAKPMKAQMSVGSNRAVWADEEWIKENAKPLGEDMAADRHEE